MGRDRLRRRPVIIGLGLFALVVSVALFTRPGATALSDCHRFLDYYSGVFSLVALSLTVMGGIVATDRLVLLVRHRVLMQAVHRATAMAAVAFLACHIATKVLEGHASPLAAVVPLLGSHHTALVGLGTVASYLMIVAAWTGVVRARFSESARPWLWRALHSCAYACWPIALLHGLTSGRRAAGWVTASYAICLVLVGLALLIRLTGKWGRHRRARRASTTSSIPRIPGSAGYPAAPRAEHRWPPASTPVPAGPAVDRAGGPDRAGGRDRAGGSDRAGGGDRAGGRRGGIIAANTDRAPAGSPRPSLQDASDDEFWAFMRGGAG